MARCNTEEISVADVQKETALLTKQAAVHIIYWPPFRRPGH